MEGLPSRSCRDARCDATQASEPFVVLPARHAIKKEVRYQLSDTVIEHLAAAGVVMQNIQRLGGQDIVSAAFRDALPKRTELPGS